MRSLVFDCRAAALKLACAISLLRYTGNKGKSKFPSAISPASRNSAIEMPGTGSRGLRMTAERSNGGKEAGVIPPPLTHVNSL